MPQDDVAFNADFHDILKDIDDLIGPDPADDPPIHPDGPVVDDEQPLPTPTVVSREEARPKLQSSLVGPQPLPHISPPSPHPHFPHPRSPHFLSPHPPQSSPMHSQPKKEKKKKRRSVGRVWEKLKGLFTGEDQQPTKLSDKLVPESDDEVRWYGFLFPKPPKPTKTRK